MLNNKSVWNIEIRNTGTKTHSKLSSAADPPFVVPSQGTAYRIVPHMFTHNYAKRSACDQTISRIIMNMVTKHQLHGFSIISCVIMNDDDDPHHTLWFKPAGLVVHRGVPPNLSESSL